LVPDVYPCVFCLLVRPPPRSPLFPYTTLFRSLRYRIDPGFFQTDLAVVINPAKWEALSDEAKAVINEAAVEYEKTSYDNFQKMRSEEHTSELQSRENLVCRLLLEKKKQKDTQT